MGKISFFFPIGPFSLSHHASYPVRTGFVFMRENSCQMLMLTAHVQLIQSWTMRWVISLLHNMSWRCFVEWSSSQSSLHYSDIVILWY